MDFLRASIGIVAIVGIALLLGKLDKHQHPAAYCYSVILSIVVLLAMRFFL